jgi:hypothetical protein
LTLFPIAFLIAGVRPNVHETRPGEHVRSYNRPDVSGAVVLGFDREHVRFGAAQSWLKTTGVQYNGDDWTSSILESR